MSEDHYALGNAAGRRITLEFLNGYSPDAVLQVVSWV